MFFLIFCRLKTAFKRNLLSLNVCLLIIFGLNVDTNVVIVGLHDGYLIGVIVGFNVNGQFLCSDSSNHKNNNEKSKRHTTAMTITISLILLLSKHYLIRITIIIIFNIINY